MSGEIRTQKTQVYICDTATTCTPIPNIADLGEFGEQSDDIETTNLDSLAKEYLTGLPDNGELTLQINLNPQNLMHQLLAANAGSGVRFGFCVALSDGTTAPTASGSVITPPLASARTSFVFTASVKSFRQAYKKNDAARVNVTLRISGAITKTWHT
jgi:hypothetical protein